MVNRLVRRYWAFGPVLLAAAALVLSSTLRSGGVEDVERQLLNAAGLRVAVQQHYQIERRFAGRVAARQDTDVGFELGGRVAQMHVNDGDRVSQGDLLASLDTELLVTERDQLKAQLSDTEARQALNRANIARHESLQASGFASQQRLDELLTEQKTLIANAEALQASLSNVASRLRKAQLRAPYSGVVARRFADQGSVVAAGSPVVRLQEVVAMEAMVGVPVGFALGLTAGQQVPLTLREQRLLGRVITVGADVNTVTNTVTVRMLLPAEAQAFNGDIIQLVMSEAIATAGYWIPAAAITDGVRGRWTVYALKEQQPGRFEVEARDVQIHHTRAEQVFVSGALSDGDLIVATGVHRLVPGQQVTTTVHPAVAPTQLGLQPGAQ